MHTTTKAAAAAEPVAAADPVAPVPSGPAHPYTAPAANRRRTRPSAGLIAAAVVVATAAVTAVGYATAHLGADDAPRTITAPSAQVTQPNPLSRAHIETTRAAITWLDANLPGQTDVLTDATIAKQLRAAGLEHVATSVASTDSAPHWIVVDPARRATSASSELLARSVAVAVFGSSDDRLEVRGVLPAPSSRVPFMIKSDRYNRELAGAALAANPHVKSAPSMHDVLVHGGLDLRAATFLAVMATDSKVDVIAAPTAPAEAQAQRPARVLRLSAADGAAAAVRTAVRSLPPQYAPASIDTSSPGSVTVTWSVSADLVEFAS